MRLPVPPLPRRWGDSRTPVVPTEARPERRPHDAEPVYTAALSHNFRAEFQDARPLLEQLHRAYPERGFVSYHLGWSCLGRGDPAAALRLRPGCAPAASQHRHCGATSE